jgi:hypothetical protein
MVELIRIELTTSFLTQGGVLLKSYFDVGLPVAGLIYFDLFFRCHDYACFLWVEMRLASMLLSCPAGRTPGRYLGILHLLLLLVSI